MVKQSIDAKVRPLSNTSLEKASLLGAARLYVSRDTLLSLTGTLDSGRACWIEILNAAAAAAGDGTEKDRPARREASLWVLPEKNLSPNVVMMTRAFQEVVGVKIGDQVRVTLGEGDGNGSTADGGEVVVRDVTEGASWDPSGYRYPPQREAAVSLALGSCRKCLKFCLSTCPFPLPGTPLSHVSDD